MYARAHNHEHQMELIDLAAGQFHQEPGVFRLLIVDSIIGIEFLTFSVIFRQIVIKHKKALLRVDFTGRGELADRQQKLGAMLSRLQKLSEEYNVVVYITNQMTSDPGAGMSFVADPKKPVGGHVLAHASQTRVSVSLCTFHAGNIFSEGTCTELI